MGDNNQQEQQQGKNKGGGNQAAKGVSLNSGFDASNDDFNLKNIIVGAICNGFGFIAAAGVAFFAKKQLVKLPFFKSSGPAPLPGGGFSFDAVNDKSGKSLAAYLAKNKPELASDMAAIITNIQKGSNPPTDVTPVAPPAEQKA